jgi:hypothetical protein
MTVKLKDVLPFYSGRVEVITSRGTYEMQYDHSKQGYEPMSDWEVALLETTVLSMKPGSVHVTPVEPYMRYSMKLSEIAYATEDAVFVYKDIAYSKAIEKAKLFEAEYAAEIKEAKLYAQHLEEHKIECMETDKETGLFVVYLA